MYRVLNLFFKIGKTYTDKVESISHLLPSDKEGLYWNVREDSIRPFLVFKDVEDSREMFLSNPCVREVEVEQKEPTNLIERTVRELEKLYTSKGITEEQSKAYTKLVMNFKDLQGKFDLNFRVCSGYYKDLTKLETKVIILPKQRDSECRNSKFLQFLKAGDVYMNKHLQGWFDVKFFDEVVFPEIDTRLPNDFKELAIIFKEFGFGVMPRYKFLLEVI